MLKKGVIICRVKPGFPTTPPENINGYTRIHNDKGDFMFFPIGVDSKNWLQDVTNRTPLERNAGSSSYQEIASSSQLSN